MVNTHGLTGRIRIRWRAEPDAFAPNAAVARSDLKSPVMAPVSILNPGRD